MILELRNRALRLLPEGRLLQRLALRELDCSQAQGYLFARPEPADRCGTALSVAR